jgi:cleavage stimulation factor subunit 3
MEEKNFKANPKNQNYLYSYALKLYNTDGKELEKLFGKFLKKSYDLRFWNLYIDYVTKVSTKKVNINDVYAFVINHFEHSYFSFVFIKSFISELSNSENSEDLIRKVYHKAFGCPMHNLGILWSDYEKWEIGVNRANARSNIEKIQPTYFQTASVYQRLLPFIDSNLFFKILDIELENPLKFPKKTFDARLSFIFNYYMSLFPENEALIFLQSFYLKDKVPEQPLSPFLSYWFSFYFKENLFNFEDRKNKQLTIVNFLNWTVKNEGIEAFRRCFLEIEDKGVYAYIYAALVEYYQGCNKKEAYQLFIEALEKDGNSPIVNEQFFLLFLKIGDEDNIRLLFKKLKKTEKMWDLMIEYEFMHGDMEAYRELLVNKQEEFKEILPPDKITKKQITSKGTEFIYETVLENLGFLDLKIENSDILADFIAQLPVLSYNENILSNFDNSLIIDILNEMIIS